MRESVFLLALVGVEGVNAFFGNRNLKEISC